VVVDDAVVVAVVAVVASDSLVSCMSSSSASIWFRVRRRVDGVSGVVGVVGVVGERSELAADPLRGRVVLRPAAVAAVSREPVDDDRSWSRSAVSRRRLLRLRVLLGVSTMPSKSSFLLPRALAGGRGC
jgi:hypothetical protein